MHFITSSRLLIIASGLLSTTFSLAMPLPASQQPTSTQSSPELGPQPFKVSGYVPKDATLTKISGHWVLECPPGLEEPIAPQIVETEYGKTLPDHTSYVNIHNLKPETDDNGITHFRSFWQPGPSRSPATTRSVLKPHRPPVPGPSQQPTHPEDLGPPPFKVSGYVPKDATLTKISGHWVLKCPPGLKEPRPPQIVETDYGKTLDDHTSFINVRIHEHIDNVSKKPTFDTEWKPVRLVHRPHVLPPSQPFKVIGYMPKGTTMTKISGHWVPKYPPRLEEPRPPQIVETEYGKTLADHTSFINDRIHVHVDNVSKTPTFDTEWKPVHLVHRPHVLGPSQDPGPSHSPWPGRRLQNA
jgi:hypothetical protein